MSVEVRFEAVDTRARDMFRRLEKSIVKDLKKEFAKEAARLAKQIVYNQQFPNATVTPGTARQKKDPRVLIDTTDYVNSFKATEDGVTANAMKSSLLNDGTSRMPPRPHWIVTRDRVRAIADQILGKVVKDASA